MNNFESRGVEPQTFVEGMQEVLEKDRKTRAKSLGNIGLSADVIKEYDETAAERDESRRYVKKHASNDSESSQDQVVLGNELEGEHDG